MHTLQVHESITLQSWVQTLSNPKRLAPSLAPVPQKSSEPTPHEMVHVPKHLPRIAVAEEVRPSPGDHVYFLDGLPERLLISTRVLPLTLSRRRKTAFLEGNTLRYLVFLPIRSRS